jgi:hypothetical protein
VHRQHRVAQAREADAMRFRRGAEQCTVTIETPGPALLDDLEAGLVVALEASDYPHVASQHSK